MDASDRRKRVAEEAAEWWVVLQGEVSRAQREQYVDWLRESSVHIAEMLHVAQVHGALEQFSRWPGIPIDGSREEGDNIVALPTTVALRNSETRSGAQARRPRKRLVWTMAAALLIALSGVTAVILLSGHNAMIQTERGERREVALDDGSVVQVDPETRLRVKYEEHVRRVVLERGRALFHVAKNTERPFLVEAKDTTVRAVGTAFAVERQENQSILVTVAEGKVAVFPTQMLSVVVAAPTSIGSAATRSEVSASSQLPPSNPSMGTPRSNEESTSTELPNESAREVLLTANQQVAVTRSGNAEAIRTVDSGRALAWADGKLIFENSSVANAVQQFNRYNRIQIIVNDGDLARRSISGVFSAAEPESFAAFLQSVARVRVTRTTNADIVIDTAI
jgi:transmembrane sensor